MKLRGIEFGNVWGASGVQGFFGEGYWFHKIPLLGPSFSGMTLVAKTATAAENRGNMPLREDYTPQHFFPSCIKVKSWLGLTINAIGLSGPGIRKLLLTGLWQQQKKPFLISLACLGNSLKDRLLEMQEMIAVLAWYKSDFAAPFGLQINLSCPNTSHDPKEIIGQAEKILEEASTLNVPLVPKFSVASAPLGAIMELNENPHCDAICVSNTIPFGWKDISWKDSWGSDVSPLADLGGGGLSGPAIKPHVLKWIIQLRDMGFTKPINGGGGIFCKKDVDLYRNAGANSIFLGTVATLRPWRVKGIINYANSLSWD